MDSIKSDGLYWNPDPRIDADPLVIGEELKAFQAACGHTWKCSKCAATPPTNPSDAANAAANAIADYVSDGITGMGNEVTDANKAEFLAIITRHLPANTSTPTVADAIAAVERLYDEWWDIDRRRWLNVVLERLRALEPKPAATTTSPQTPVGGEPQNQDMETCPVCKNLVPLDSMFSYNNVPNAFCQGCVDSGRVGGND